MIFDTFSYFLLFLLPAALLFRGVAPSFRAPVISLFGAAFFIYFSLTTVGGVAGAFCLGLFLWEALVSRFYRPGSALCLLGIVQALVILFVFKYWNFTAGLVAGPGTSWRWTGAFLPLGISFFTFEFIHYARDRRENRTEAGGFWEYLAFILFFPTMVAGPIKRYQDFLPTLRSPTRDWANDFERGCTRILAGLAKKFVVADCMTSLTQHLNATDIARAERWILPFWLLAYAVKIYFDFSAYSDIAIGSARLFGMKVKENFDWPYACENITSFWRHWHMSLTRWLTDYVFIPLGGSRVATGRIYFNVLATFLVSGLWHGAGLNFVVWGLWHGAALCVHRWWTGLRGDCVPSTPVRWINWGLTMTVVTLGWAWFTMDLPTALLFYKRLFLG